MEDATFQAIMRVKLRVPLVPASATCTHVPASANRACGCRLTPGVDHAHSCAKGARTARHHRLRDWWWQRCKDSGALADREQVVYELGQISADRTKQRVADVRASGGASIGTVYYDVVVSHFRHLTVATGEWRADGRGVAAARAETAKHRDYRPGLGGRPVTLVPLAAETGGRWGPAAEKELIRLARATVLRAQEDACAAADHSATAAVLCRWRQELSCLLQRGNWGVLAACAGGVDAGTRPSGRPAGELAQFFGR